MSSLIVEVCAVEEIAAIENADRIERVRVKNWWCVTGKGTYKVGDKVVFVPPNSIINEKLANKWGITKYCPKLPEMMCEVGETLYRIKAARFRGVPSFGTIQNCDDPSWPVGHDVKEYYKITKYEPPIKCQDGDADFPLISFHEYTNIENIGNFPNVFKEGENVIVTEKIHGTNCRLGYVYSGKNQNGDDVWEITAGSYSVRRKEIDNNGKRSKYWMPFKGEECPIRDLLVSLALRKNPKQSVILFGEIFGQGIQDMDYGQKMPNFRAFDIAIDGEYLDWDEMVKELSRFDIEPVPVIYRGPFSMEKMNELVDGPTVICNTDKIRTPFKGREGIVIKPEKESYNQDMCNRTILKYISVDYHERRNPNPTEDH